MITSPEQFAGLALLKIGSAKTAAELATLKADCDSASEWGDITEVEHATLMAAHDAREPVVALLDAIRDAADNDSLSAVGKRAHAEMGAGTITAVQYDEVCRAGRVRRAELKGQDQ